jgi:hypothetical protein
MSKRGKKDCPSCNTELGARTLICPECKFDFSSAKKEVEVKEDSESPIIKKPDNSGYATKVLAREEKNLPKDRVPFVPVKMTSEDYANQILSYGIERATMLLNLHKWCGYWNHVNWNIVEQGLK